jgi:DNA topoisomerase IA
LKLQSGEKKILQFNPEEIEQVEAEFNEKKSKRLKCTLIDEEKSNQEKYLEVGKTASEEIHSFLIRGTTKLNVQNVCLGLDTDYHT